jgi:hypothetical protein
MRSPSGGFEVLSELLGRCVGNLFFEGEDFHGNILIVFAKENPAFRRG